MDSRVVILYYLVVAVFLVKITCDPVRPCRSKRFSYSIADSEQCDQFYRCRNGEMTEELCPDGQVYEPGSQSCFMPQRVICGKRKHLRKRRRNVVCPRLLGRLTPTDSAFKNDRFGGLIFDEDQAVCEFPDMANHAECSAYKILNFTYPYGSNVQSDNVVLFFGDHERFPKKEDCQHFFMCLKSGRPRQGGCPIASAYNPNTFLCDKPANVPG
ncbi:protein obstructor-E-like [Daphnia carinata]|uniref:protein obstructor-E-like n=1 Tax=Daphnia carinata TaxID=120202 RepID=UPI00257D69AB|nr:protein obstructor-E-like [Daphnia carinata]